MSPEERDDELLEEYLRGDAELSRRYRHEAREEPSAALDARILAEARRAVTRERRVVHSPFARHWMVPASLAAVLVLSVAVVLLVPGPDSGLDAPVRPAADAVEAPAPGKAKQERTAPTRARQAEPAAAPAPAEPASRLQADDAAGETGAQPESAASEREAAAGREAGAASMSAPGAGAPPRHMEDDPEQWLRHVESLLAGGQEPRARDSLRAFLARYPDYPLPEGLQPLARALSSETR